MKWKEREHFHHLPDACNAGYHNSIQMLFSHWKHSKVTFSLADTKMRAPFVCSPLWMETGSISATLRHYWTIVWCLAMCVSYLTPYNKQRWRTGGCKIAVSYLWTFHNACMSSFQAVPSPLVTVFSSHFKVKWNARENLLESCPSGKSEQRKNLSCHSIHHTLIQRGDT